MQIKFALSLDKREPWAPRVLSKKSEEEHVQTVVPAVIDRDGFFQGGVLI